MVARKRDLHAEADAILEAAGEDIGIENTYARKYGGLPNGNPGGGSKLDEEEQAARSRLNDRDLEFLYSRDTVFGAGEYKIWELKCKGLSVADIGKVVRMPAGTVRHVVDALSAKRDAYFAKEIKANVKRFSEKVASSVSSALGDARISAADLAEKIKSVMDGELDKYIALSRGQEPTSPPLEKDDAQVVASYARVLFGATESEAKASALELEKMSQSEIATLMTELAEKLKEGS